MYLISLKSILFSTGVYGFNQLVSDEMTLNRTVPDLREPECQHWDYPTKLPKASVIMVFHNEGWSTLFRTVHSVLNRSPPQFLEEVLLVDDKSELEHLHEKLENELEKPLYKGRVRLVRNSEREGLIRSRNNGAVAARGKLQLTLFFKAYAFILSCMIRRVTSLEQLSVAEFSCE